MDPHLCIIGRLLDPDLHWRIWSGSRIYKLAEIKPVPELKPELEEKEKDFKKMYQHSVLDPRTQQCRTELVPRPASFISRSGSRLRWLKSTQEQDISNKSVTNFMANLKKVSFYNTMLSWLFLILNVARFSSGGVFICFLSPQSGSMMSPCGSRS